MSRGWLHWQAVLLTAAGCTLAAARALWLLPAVARRGWSRLNNSAQALGERLVAESRGELASARADIVREIRASRRQLLQRLDLAGRRADEHAAAALMLLDNRSRELVGAAADVAADVDAAAIAALDQYGAMAARTTKLIELLTPQALGLVAAGKVTAGELAQTARTWRRETPEIAANVRETSRNVAAVTRLSKWHKIMLMAAAAAAAIGVVR